jgi:hypothetical protein
MERPSSTIPTKIPLHFLPFPPESTGIIPNKQVFPCVSFEVFTAVIIQTVILVVTPCGLVGGYQYRVPQITVFVLFVAFNCPCYFSLPLTFKGRNFHTKCRHNPTTADTKYAHRQIQP